MNRLRKKLHLSILGYLLVACFACIVQSCAESQAPKKLFEHVVIIGIDGLSSDGLHRAETPVMDYLIANGSVKYDMRAVLPSNSMANWGAMICGAHTEASGITSNSWEPDGQWMQPVTKNQAGLFPTIYDLIREQIPDSELGAIYHWGAFGRMVPEKVANYRLHCPTADEATEKAREYIVAKKPNFLFIHLDHVDGAGHRYGYKSDDYLKVVANCDSLIGRIVESVRAAGMAENTLIMVVSDHGGFNKGHGGESTCEVDVPIILYGSGIKRNYTVQQAVYVFDVGATAAFALNLKVPHAWTGRPVLAVFEGHSEPE